MQTLSLPKKLAVAVVGAFVVYFLLSQFGIGPTFKRQAAVVPKAFNLTSDVPVSASATAPVTVSLPSSVPAPRKGSPVRIETIPWNATMGLMLANGGPVTMKGSLMEKYGVTTEIKVVKDSSISQQSQAKFATDYAAGTDTPDGPAFVIIMGDGAAQYLAGINKMVTKLGPDYRAENIGHVGYSAGEDGCWGPQAWKDNPEAMKGGAIAAVLRDGDWNICQYLLANSDVKNSDNSKGTKNNPDEKTWDPEAVNWFAADDFEKAVEAYVSGVCEDRPVVRNGKLTNEPKHHTCVEGVATWTPADVSLAKKKGGLVRLLSTKENANQMPATLIGIHKWNVAHARQVQAVLKAAFDGGAQVRVSDDALQRGAKASYAVYGEESPGYWAKYYKGTVERDKTGMPVPLGGSRVATLADNMAFYGLADGTGGADNSLWRATYEGFGNIAKQQYPRLVPDFPKYDVAFNPMFLKALAVETPTNADVAKADLPTFSEGAIEKADVVAKRNWTINFDTGKATIRPDSVPVLNDIYTQLLQGSALAVEFDGHTDNTGNSTANYGLSQRRAAAVRDYMVAKAPALFPTNRVTVQGFGDTTPVASNATETGRAQNRRVTVILGTK